MSLDSEQARPEIKAALEAYLPRLAAAYAEVDPAPLAQVAVPKELAHVQLRADEMAKRGERIVSQLEQLTVDTIRLARSTAYVATTEVWDLELRTVGSDRVLHHYPHTRYQVRYQLKRDSGRWLVVFRQLIEPPASG